MNLKSGCTPSVSVVVMGERATRNFLSKREMRFSNSGITAHALSMNVLDMVILVKGNYDGVVKETVISLHLFKMNKWTKIII